MKTLRLLSLALLLAACQPVPPSPAPVTSLPPTAIPPTATPAQPAAFLLEEARLLYVPDSRSVDSLLDLRAGEEVFPLASYGDFVLVRVGEGESAPTGFLPREFLEDLPASLEVMPSEILPLNPLYDANCSQGEYNPATAELTYTYDSADSYDTETDAITLESPLIIRIGGMDLQRGEFAAVKVVGRPEVQDPWWKDITRMDIIVADGNYYINFRDGTSEGYIFDAIDDLALDASGPIQIVFEDLQGKSFTLLDGAGKLIRRVDLTTTPGLNLPDGLFPDGKVYIGTTVTPYTTLRITALEAGELPDGRWEGASAPGPGLAALAKAKGITLGTEFSYYSAMDMQYCRVMQDHYNLAVLSEFSNPDYWLAPGEYDFTSIDRAVDYALRHGWTVRASHLVWGEPSTLPRWLLEGRFSRDEYIEILKQHVTTLATRYSGKVTEWSIANEAPRRSFYPGSDFWYDHIGREYIGMAFRWAREADPQGLLFFNQDNNESPRDADSTRIIEMMYFMLKEMVDAGVPVDAVGMQMHLFLPWNSRLAPQKEDVIATMHRFSDLGVRILITEFDVSLTRQRGTQEEKWAYEAQLYRDMLEACLESKVCDSFTTWGISDSTSWITCDREWCGNEPEADPLMFDRDFNPKPAFYAVQEVLSAGSTP